MTISPSVVVMIPVPIDSAASSPVPMSALIVTTDGPTAADDRGDVDPRQVAAAGRDVDRLARGNRRRRRRRGRRAACRSAHRPAPPRTRPSPSQRRSPPRVAISSPADVERAGWPTAEAATVLEDASADRRFDQMELDGLDARPRRSARRACFEQRSRPPLSARSLRSVLAKLRQARCPSAPCLHRCFTPTLQARHRVADGFAIGCSEPASGHRASADLLVLTTYDPISIGPK